MVSQALFAWRAAPPLQRRVPSAQGQASLSITGQPKVSAGQPSDHSQEALDQSWTARGTYAIHCWSKEIPWTLSQPFLTQASHLPARQGNLEAIGAP